VRGELDLLVPPLGRPVDAGDQAGAVQAPEVAVDEREAPLALVRGALGETEVPLAVVLPVMRAEEAVLVFRARLRLAPVAVEDVLARLDQPFGVSDRGAVDLVRGDRPSVTPMLVTEEPLVTSRPEVE